MSDPERERDRDPEVDPTDPVPMEPARPSLWQWPLVRGVVNGAFFAVMLCVIQVYGIFRPARPLDHDTVAGNIMAGVVFGAAMYFVELWRWHRRRNAAGRQSPAAEAARRAVEDRLRRGDPEDPDSSR